MGQRGDSDVFLYCADEDSGKPCIYLEKGLCVKTLAIVGSHPRTRTDFDFNRTDCDIWVFNEALSTEWATRADAVFQMHEQAIWRNPKNRNDPNHPAWLANNQTVDVFMQERYADVPKAVEYPLDDVLGLLSKSHFYKNGERKPVRYFNSSVDYALALGIQKGYKKIEVYGVELETETEYFYQRAGFAFWLGYASGFGIELELHTAVLDAPIYGYEGEVVLDYSMFVERVAELESMVKELQAQYEIQMAASAKQFDKFVEHGSKSDVEDFVKLLEVQRTLGQQLHRIGGAQQENKKYIEKADTMKENSGAFLFSRQEFEGAARDMQQRALEATRLSSIAGGRAEVLLTGLVNASKEKHRTKRAGDFMQQIREHLEQLFYASLFQGVYEENMRFMSILDASIKAAGGAKSEAVLLEAYANRQ